MTAFGTRLPDEYSVRDDLRQHRIIFLALLVALVIWGATDVRQRGIVDPLRPDRHKTDFTVYTEAGAAFFDGRDPYQVTNIRGWGYIYPPLFAMLVSPLHALGPRSQVLVFYAFSCVLAFGCYFEGRKLAASVWRRAFEQGFVPGSCTTGDWLATACAWSLPALNCLQRGQVGLLKLYPLLIGFRWAVFGSTAWQRVLGGVVLAFPVVLKLTPLLPIACLIAMLAVFCWRMRAHTEPLARWSQMTGGVILGSLLFWLLIPAAMVGWDANVHHLESWYVKVVMKAPDVRGDDFGGDVTSPRNQSFANAAYRMGNWLAYIGGYGPYDRMIDTADEAVGQMPMDSAAANHAVLLVRLICLGWLGLAVLKLGWRGDPLSIITVYALACAATLVVSPVSRGHYFVLLGPICLAVPALLRAEGWHRRANWISWTPAVLCMLHYVLLEQAGRVGLLGVGLTVWMVVATGMVLQTHSPLPEGASGSSDSPDGKCEPRLSLSTTAASRAERDSESEETRRDSRRAA